MIIFTEKITNEKYLVRSIVYNESILSEENKAKGIEIESIPDPTPGDNQTYYMYYNPITGAISYEYEDIPQL